MENSKFLALMADENAHVTLNVSSDNLRAFALYLVNTVKGEVQVIQQSQQVEKEPKDVMMSRQEACNYLGICPTTIWKWAKEGILTPIQSPTKQLKYRKSDLDRILNGESQAAE